MATKGNLCRFLVIRWAMKFDGSAANKILLPGLHIGVARRNAEKHGGVEN